MIDFQVYQEQSSNTAIYPEDIRLDSGLIYVALGLTNEAGEIAGVIKKMIRDSGGEMTPEIKQKLAAEAGDLLWYLARLCTEVELRMEDVAQANLVNLADRQGRGVLQGSGDDR